MPNFRYESIPESFVERPCEYLGGSLVADSVQQSHELLHEKLPDLSNEVLCSVIDKA